MRRRGPSEACPSLRACPPSPFPTCAVATPRRPFLARSVSLANATPARASSARPRTSDAGAGRRWQPVQGWRALRPLRGDARARGNAPLLRGLPARAHRCRQRCHLRSTQHVVRRSSPSAASGSLARSASAKRAAAPGGRRVEVSRYQIGDSDGAYLYVPSDGMHRARVSLRGPAGQSLRETCARWGIVAPRSARAQSAGRPRAAALLTTLMRMPLQREESARDSSSENGSDRGMTAGIRSFYRETL